MVPALRPGSILEDILIITSRKTVAGLATLGASALLLAGCAAPPPEAGEEPTGEAPGGEASDFVPCMVSDAGGFDDNSFNELGLTGLERASEDLGATPITVESADESAYAPNITNLVDQGCNLIVTVGFLLSEATIEAANANPDVNFAIIDDQLDADQDGAPDVENGKPIVFDTAQAAFLAGYAAASYSSSGVVGTFGGVQIPPVTIFMDGFYDGVQYWNEESGESVEVVGWDKENGSFTGGFAAGTEARQAAQTLIDQGADVILPVGGPIYTSAAEAIRDANEGGAEIALIGVDADVYETDPSVADLLLTSIRKQVDAGVEEVVLAAAGGNFDNSLYIGTLENEGVGLAPFHDFEDKVDPELQSQIDELRQMIIAGDITVESPSSPQQ
ncbi:MAG: BMP family ABC transporter substrate-binding protein [Actinomycetota bacterium]|nr:BMP family ABC transporter substrate-binding protein [Actinomycetota bacterium]